MAKKQFTYMVSVSFEMRFSFPESDVEQSDEGAEGEMDPTDKALVALEQEIAERLGEHFQGVKNVEAWTDCDDLLGIDEE